MLSSIRIFASIFTLLTLLAAAPSSTHAQTANVFTVDSNGDASDASAGDGTCATTEGECTLRAAIEEANATANAGEPDRIEFSISTGTYFSPKTPLPEITAPVVIDGTTASSGTLPRVRIDGGMCAGCGDGLVINADDSEIYGLQIIRFQDNGIVLDGSNNVVENCSIGDMLSSGSPLGYGNGGAGIRIEAGANQNRIGGTSTDARNIISGNAGGGIFVYAGDENVIQGNYVGISEAGDVAIGNGGTSSYNGAIEISGASDNQIGGTSDAARNVVSGNDYNGIVLSGAGATGNEVLGNYVGTTADGTAELENKYAGILVVNSAASNRIGVMADGTVAGNVVAGNRLSGVKVSGGASGTIVQGNQIGQAADGSSLGNGGSGVYLIHSAENTTIGGTASEEANVITGNNGRGVNIASNAGDGNSVRGNKIFENGSLGIDLNADGVTSNDIDDSDDGPNRLQNSPEIVDAEYNEYADQVSITYFVPSDPNASGDGASVYPLQIDFYEADADGEEGAAYLGSATFTTGDYDNGTGWIGFTPEAPIANDAQIVATATDANGNTSEFSAVPWQLPVELATFEATADGEVVRLTWQTASETNNAGFAVERKVEDAAFEEVGFVEGRGTTSDAQTYRFEDATLPYEAERVIYRLAQVDTDGATEYSSEVEVALAAPGRLALHGNYPNPARSTTTIHYELPKAARVQLALYDMLGRQVAVLVDRKQAAGRKEMTVDTSGLPSGFYLYRLQAGADVETRRMTVVK